MIRDGKLHLDPVSISDEDAILSFRIFEKVLKEHCDEHDIVGSTVCATHLAVNCFNAELDRYESVLHGVTDGDVECGTWKVTVERISDV